MKTGGKPPKTCLNKNSLQMKHLWKWTWNLKIIQLKRNIIWTKSPCLGFQRLIFGWSNSHFCHQNSPSPPSTRNVCGWGEKKACPVQSWRISFLVGGFNPHLKHISQIGKFSPNRDENKKCLKSPPTFGWEKILNSFEQSEFVVRNFFDFFMGI